MPELFRQLAVYPCFLLASRGIQEHGACKRRRTVRAQEVSDGKRMSARSMTRGHLHQLRARFQRAWSYCAARRRNRSFKNYASRRSLACGGRRDPRGSHREAGLELAHMRMVRARCFRLLAHGSGPAGVDMFGPPMTSENARNSGRLWLLLVIGIFASCGSEPAAGDASAAESDAGAMHRWQIITLFSPESNENNLTVEINGAPVDRLEVSVDSVRALFELSASVELLHDGLVIDSLMVAPDCPVSDDLSDDPLLRETISYCLRENGEIRLASQLCQYAENAISRDGVCEVPQCAPGRCGEGRCGLRVLKEDPYLRRLECQPRGNLSEGTACSRDSSGVDNCASGVCHEGVCRDLCRLDLDRCGAERLCTAFDSAYPNAGLCQPFG